MSAPIERVDIVIIGAGPAGLSAASELRRRGAGSVVVLEREADAGGIPRHSDHPGYGLRDLRRVLTGPSYAQRLVGRALHVGADLRTRSMVTGWNNDDTLWVTSPGGRYRLQAQAIVLATGARERPRTARLVAGDRPPGVMTTGQLQNVVNVQGRSLDGVAVVVGAELVSWSAVLTLRHAGCRTTLMTTQHRRPESYAAFTVPGRAALSVRVATQTAVTRVVGADRVRGVEITHLLTGASRVVPCDVVVFTGDWIPDNELARHRELQLDAGHRGPIVDTALRTSADGVFAAGNLLHPVDTADVAALDGVHVAEQVQRHLQGAAPPGEGVRLRAHEPFSWVSPGIICSPNIAPPRSRVLLWSTQYRAIPVVEVCQGGAVLARRRLPWPVSPGRVFRLPWSMFAAVRIEDGDVDISLR